MSCNDSKTFWDRFEGCLLVWQPPRNAPPIRSGFDQPVWLVLRQHDWCCMIRWHRLSSSYARLSANKEEPKALQQAKNRKEKWKEVSFFVLTSSFVRKTKIVCCEMVQCKTWVRHSCLGEVCRVSSFGTVSRLFQLHSCLFYLQQVRRGKPWHFLVGPLIPRSFPWNQRLSTSLLRTWAAFNCKWLWHFVLFLLIHLLCQNNVYD